MLCLGGGKKLLKKLKEFTWQYHHLLRKLNKGSNFKGETIRVTTTIFLAQVMVLT